MIHIPERLLELFPGDPDVQALNAVSYLGFPSSISMERKNIQRALACCGGKVSGEAGAARLLGIPPTTLSSRMKALGIQRKG